MPAHGAPVAVKIEATENAGGPSKTFSVTCAVIGTVEIAQYRPKEWPNGAKIMHPRNGEEAWWPLLGETGEPLSQN